MDMRLSRRAYAAEVLPVAWFFAIISRHDSIRSVRTPITQEGAVSRNEPRPASAEMRPGRLNLEERMLNAKQCVLYSGGAAGTEQFFGALAEGWGIEEVNYSFEGHQTERKRGVRVLTSEELALKDVSLTYVSRLMNREYTQAPLFRKILQSICWQVSSGSQVVVVGAIQPDNTVKGGTGWGAEFAKICNKPLLVFDQVRNGWFEWNKSEWVPVEEPVVTQTHFCATGTRFLEDNGRDAIQGLFKRSFNR